MVASTSFATCPLFSISTPLRPALHIRIRPGCRRALHCFVCFFLDTLLDYIVFASFFFSCQTNLFTRRGFRQPDKSTRTKIFFAASCCCCWFILIFESHSGNRRSLLFLSQSLLRSWDKKLGSCSYFKVQRSMCLRSWASTSVCPNAFGISKRENHNFISFLFIVWRIEI